MFFQETMPLTMEDLTYLGIAIGGFFVNHLFSFVKNFKRDKKRGVNFMEPYARILPMHLTIIFGGMLPSHVLLVALFIGLKTYFDMKGHWFVHA